MIPIVGVRVIHRVAFTGPCGGKYLTIVKKDRRYLQPQAVFISQTLIEGEIELAVV